MGNQSSTNSTPVYAFESVPDYETQSIIYMPSALCNYPTAATPQSTFYGIQNTSSSLYANVTVGYYDLNGTLVGQQSNSIAPSDKWSHSTCSTTGLPANFSGSAVIQSSNSVFLAAVGKVTGSGVSSGFMAQATGSSTLYLPYQRYASDTNWLNGTRHRTFNAIQNIGGSLLANAICTTFYDAAGVQAGSQVCNSTVLNQYQKYNPHPSSAGLTNDWGYGASEYGSAVVRCPTCSSNQLISVTRVTSYIDASTAAAEDYVGLK